MNRIIVLLLSLLVITSHSWADVSTPTEFTEADGSPSVFDPWKVSASNGTVTDNGDGSISITTGGGSGTPGGANANVQYNDASSFGGDSAFSWNENANTLSISRDAAQTGHAIRISSDTGASLANVSHDGTAFFVGLELTNSLVVIEGGTGASSHTDGAVLLGDGTSAITNTGVLTKGVILVGDGTTDPTLLTVGANGTILSADSAETSGVRWAVQQGKPPREFYWPASALMPLEFSADSIPPISKDSGTNIDNLNRAFDDSADECVTGNLIVPMDINAVGTVTIRTKTYAVAPAATNVLWKFNHTPRDAGESWDAALTEVSFDVVTFSATQDILSEGVQEVSVATLGWVSSDTVLFQFCRDGNGAGDTLVNDALMVDLAIEVPRS